ncbi:hypothetical protein RJ639_047291 [Escallonia herrerae]|uniref:Beta-glucosidase 11-like n=1 Tax=Escallonia herrerae TaxID=1293975 RepID=A0AA89AXP4_9ASTE|nr:hypothetical protein RJ639_047291 [Escallonia herrerae]
MMIVTTLPISECRTDFVAYADVCFREFGDRVLHWTTFNEANIFALGGYDLGVTPPGRCSPPFGINCTRGNSSNEPYIVGHNILLAHASAARLYQKKYKVTQHGFVGLNLFAYWFVPYTNAMEDAIATQRANDFYVGWIVNPLVFGDYPDIVKQNAGTRIPAFTKHESKQLKGSFDFLGVNQYNRLYIKDKPCSLEMESRDFSADMAVQLICQRTQRNGTLNDTPRVEYLHGFIGSLLDAVRNGSNTRGYFTWSFLDVFELLDGYESSFGLYYVDLDDKGLKRHPKLSADWYSNFLKGGSIGPDEVIVAEKKTSASS